ncbi:MAG: hypothetical protein KAG37_06650 [Flavobacteriales bacterium]|nr:hypothetical protein [Flavobacteriales bacterium]
MVKDYYFSFLFITSLLLINTVDVKSQSLGLTQTDTTQEEDLWDNQVYLGNKVTFGSGTWRYAAELQVRLKNDFQELDNWYVEFTASNLLSNKFEVVYDFRASIKPNIIEYRPGLGLLYKNYEHKLKFTNQTKVQLDLSNHGEVGVSAREVIFMNYSINDNITATMVAGIIYKWKQDWHGIQYVRVGPGITYTFDEQHRLNFSYFVGLQRDEREISFWSGIPMIQLVIDISKNDKFDYTPARYLDF